MNNKPPVRLQRIEPLTYNRHRLYLTGCLFIIVTVIFAFTVGSENFNYILLNTI